MCLEKLFLGGFHDEHRACETLTSLLCESLHLVATQLLPAITVHMF